MIRFSTEVVHDLSQALQLEWLETNGMGGFASSTIIGANTRRYHGLLVAATRPPVGRRVLLSKVEERLRVGGDTFHLSTNIYEGALHPGGYHNLVEFRLDPWPVMTYRIGRTVLVRSILMRHGYDTIVIKYHLTEADRPCQLLVRPLMACRDYHHLQQAQADFAPHLAVQAERFAMQPYEQGAQICLTYPGGQFWTDGLWYYDFHYPQERRRGLDCTEDLYSPGEITWLINPGETVYLCASRQPPQQVQPQQWAEEERKRRRRLVAGLPANDGFGPTLATAADQFIVRRDGEDREAVSIIAGYPWFTDWGRDAMIALPGLLLATGRHTEARTVLSAFADATDQGLIPNVFGDTEAGPAYNTVDATLWLFVAAHHYFQATGDLDFIAEELLPVLTDMVDWYIKGTKFNIEVDDDGLLSAGDENTQLTWMDAKVGNWVVTPRHGKPVEINALWYNALRILADFAEKVDDRRLAQKHGKLAEETKASFQQTFWSPEHGYLYDCVRAEYKDAALRPNQVIALSLPYPLLGNEQARQVLAKIEETLLTPYGLRTLARGSAGYAGRYEGDQVVRDSAYHQGTVWPWLLGPYIDAHFRLHGVNAETKQYVRDLLRPLQEHLSEAGLGSISEIFDGDAPHQPRGCIAQAWSVGEMLRCWTEYQLFEQ